MSDLREVPSVDQLLQTQKAASLVADYGRPMTLEAIREALSRLRQDLIEGSKGAVVDRENLLEEAQKTLDCWSKPSLIPVINASGVILHTNLGRAPLSKAAQQALGEVSSGYSNLEYDLESGRRGSRSVHAEGLLKRLTGAEAALVVNNNAAALLLCLSALARRKRVVIARSQLVEIGGGFRIPDVLAQSGAKLVEVGTTNRVHLEDFAQALDQPAALVMRAHHSNFKIVGFTTEPDLSGLVKLAHARNTLLLDDLGSGALLDTQEFGLSHEPTVQESIQAGADLVCFSGDKLLGGPQAGIILGRAELLARIKKHALARAVRADKMCLAALSATLLHYIKDEALREIPVWRMIAAPQEQVHERANAWRAALGEGDVIAGQSTVGGGSLPEEVLPTWLLALKKASPGRLIERLRKAAPPVIARVESDTILFDPRTVLPEQEGAFLTVLKAVIELDPPRGRNQAK